MSSVEELAAEIEAIAGLAPVSLLVRYAHALLSRYETSGDVADVDRAIEAGGQAVVAAEKSRRQKAVALNLLAIGYVASYQERGLRADLKAGLAAQREAVESTDADDTNHAAFVINLANRLIFNFSVSRDPAALGEAIATMRGVLGGDLSDALRAAALNNLGLALRARYDVSGDQDDLRESLKAQQEALGLAADDPVERVNLMTNLANAWWTLYVSTGILADLDEAVATYEAAVLCPANPTTRAACLLGLGAATWSRWGRSQRPVDLAAAIATFSSAAQLVDDASPTSPHCALNLGAAFFARWRYLWDRSDLDLAITEWTLARTHPVATAEVADSATANLGAAFWERYEFEGAEGDLNRAIDLLGEIPGETPATPQPGRVLTLAGALQRRFELRSDEIDLHQAVEEYRQACILGLTRNPGVSLSAGQRWGAWAARRGSLAEADEAFTRATAAATSLYGRQRSDRHIEVWLSEAITLAARHAHVKLRRDLLPDAVVTLERGRAYLLSEALTPDAIGSPAG